MRVIPTGISEVLLIEPQVFEDERGFFMETWNAGAFRSIGLDVGFVQDNHSRSCKGTLRGLHYQLPPRAQGKLVRVSAGEIYDVAVDIRRSSATFGKWVGEVLSAENRRMMWIPPGFAHGFCVTGEVADVLYKCTDLYAPDLERCIRWDDEAIGISWPLQAAPLLSAKDAAAPRFRDAEVFS